MDVVLKSKEPTVKVPYFGQQSRFFEFFDKVISPLMDGDGIYAETNSGSNGNAFVFAEKGYKVIINDVGEYSNSIAKAILSDEKPIIINELSPNWLNDYKNTYIERASVYAALMDIYGYNAIIPRQLEARVKMNIDKYILQLERLNQKNIRAYKIFQMELFDYLKLLKKENIVVDVLFMDFAWPWRDGSKTEEYNNTANLLSNIFQNTNNKIEIWDKTNILEKVIDAVNNARKVSKYVLLSNQSSNFPDSEILEVELLKNGIEFIRHTMLTDAEYEDNLGKVNFFREYVYVIKGD